MFPPVAASQDLQAVTTASLALVKSGSISFPRGFSPIKNCSEKIYLNSTTLFARDGAVLRRRKVEMNTRIWAVFDISVLVCEVGKKLYTISKCL
jgi:hypothetical protein